LNQNGGGFARCDFADEVHEFGHLRGDADHAVITDSAADCAAQGLDFSAEAGGFERVPDRDLKFVEIHGLADKVVGSELERGFHVVELRVGCDHDDGAGVAIFFEFVENLDAGEVGHADIEQDEVGRFALG